jgi:hypothetical protein
MQQEDLQNLIAKKIMLGMSHQEIYEELDAAFPGRELDIAALIAELPTLEQRKRYGIGRHLMLGLTGLAIGLCIYDAVLVFYLIGFSVFPLLECFAIAGMAFLGTLVWRWRSSGFKVMAYLSGIMLGLNLMLYAAIGERWYVVAQLVVFALMSILGMWLGIRLGGKYKSYAPSTQVRNANGEIRTRFKIKFLD